MGKTFIIRDHNRKNPREVTLVQYRAEVDAAKKVAMANFRAGAKEWNAAVVARYNDADSVKARAELAAAKRKVV